MAIQSFVSWWFFLMGLTCLSAQEITWSAPQMKPDADRAAVAEAWLGTHGAHTYLALSGGAAGHVLQLSSSGDIIRTLTPELEVGRSQGEYLYSALLADRLVVFAATGRGKSSSYLIHARAFDLPGLSPIGNWVRLETGPSQLGDEVGSMRTFALSLSPDRQTFALLSAPYPNPRIKGYTMMAVVVDTGLTVRKRHLLMAPQDDPLQRPDGFAVDDSGRLLVYQLDRSQGTWLARSLSLSGAAHRWEVGEEGTFLHSYLLQPQADGWQLIGFAGQGQAPTHQGLFTTTLDLAQGTHSPLRYLSLLDQLPSRMTKDPRYSLDLQLFAYQPTHWLTTPQGRSYLVAQQRMAGGNDNDAHLRQQVQVAAPQLFPHLHESARSYAYQGMLMLAITEDFHLDAAQFLPRKGPSKIPLNHAPAHGLTPTAATEVGLGYTAARHGQTLHLAFNEYPDELGQPLSARANPSKFKQEEASLIHWRWDGQSEPTSWPLFANASAQIYLQPQRCSQTSPDLWWLYGTAASDKQFFIGHLRW
jgi:hypothetical protein